MLSEDHQNIAVKTSLLLILKHCKLCVGDCSQSTFSTSPSNSRSIPKEDGGFSVQSKKATGASVMASEKDDHAAPPTQEPLSHRMSDSGLLNMLIGLS